MTHPYLSGEIQSTRIDVKALDLVLLGIKNIGKWDPKEKYWGEDDEHIDEWALPIIAHGPRPMFQMEQVMPGETPDDPFNHPIKHIQIPFFRHKPSLPSGTTDHRWMDIQAQAILHL